MGDQPTLRSLTVTAEALAPLLAVELSDWTSHALIPASAHREAATATAPRTEPALMEAPQFVRETPGRTSGRVSVSWGAVFSEARAPEQRWSGRWGALRPMRTDLLRRQRRRLARPRTTSATLNFALHNMAAPRAAAASGLPISVPLRTPDLAGLGKPALDSLSHPARARAPPPPSRRPRGEKDELPGGAVRWRHACRPPRPPGRSGPPRSPA